MIIPQSSHLQRLGERIRYLIEPFTLERHEEEWLTARFLASLFLVIGLFLIFVMPFRYLTIEDSGHRLLSMGTSAVSGLLVLFSYWLTRKGYYRFASGLAVVYASLMIFVFTAVNTEGTHLRPLYYLMVLTLFGSLFLSSSVTVLIGLAQAGGMLILPQFVADLPLHEVVEGPLMFNLLLLFFLLAMGAYRGRLDAARRYRLADMAARYRSLVEEVNDVVYSLSADGVVVAVNQAFEMIAGWRADQVIGRSFTHFIHPDDLVNAREAFVKVLKGDTNQIFEMRVLTVDGDYVPLELRGTPHYVNGKLFGISGVARDVTRRKQASKQELEYALQRERLSMVTQFVQAISHDFRTALATIETSRYLIERYLNLAELNRIEAKLDTIRHSVIHMNDQLENLHTVSALVDLERIPCDINTLVEQVIFEHSAQARARGQMIVFLPNQYVPKIAADSGELHQAIKHLLVNALNFTPPNGTITLRTSVSGGQVILEVTDTGIGIPEEQQTKIFNLFYRVDEARRLESGGVGLGLTIVKLVAEAHGGDVQVESQPGRGSTFTLHIPVERPAA